MHEDLVTYGFGVEELARLGIRGAHQTGEQIRLLPDRTRVHAGAHERVCRPEQLRVVTAVTLPARAPRSAGEERQIRAGLGHAQDALPRALRNGHRERARVAAAVEQAEVVAARAASR